MAWYCRNCKKIRSTSTCPVCGGDCDDIQKDYFAKKEGGTGGGNPSG